MASIEKMQTDPPPYSEELKAILYSAKELTNWIALRYDNLAISSKHRYLIPGLLFDLTIEHHVAIVTLVGHHINGSAFALLRGALEAFVRGAWLQLCASDKEFQLFYEKDKIPDKLHFSDLVEDIEKQPDFADKFLSQLQNSSWKAMNSYTHGGMLQLGKRVNGRIIEPNFESEEIVEMLKASGFFALIALRQIARLSKNKSVELEVEAKLVGT